MANTNLGTKRRFSRRVVTIFWSVIVAAITIALLSYQRIDVLYILATLALVALLVVVATADLEGKSRGNDEVKM